MPFAADEQGLSGLRPSDERLFHNPVREWLPTTTRSRCRVCCGTINSESCCYHLDGNCVTRLFDAADMSALIVEIFPRGTGSVGLGKRKHQQNACFLKAEVIGEHTCTSLEGQR
jgi:hypothetical protein